MWKAPIYRIHYKKKYGTRCFLRPRDQAYPICSHGKIDCKGLRAAKYYLRLNRKSARKSSANTKKISKLWKKAQTLTRKYCKIN